MPMQKRTRWLALAVAAAAGLSLYWLWPRGYCRSAERAYGIRVPVCPDGTPRQILSIRGENLQRNGTGSVVVSARAAYTTARADSWQYATVRDFEAAVSLVDAGGEETPLEPDKDKGWSRAFIDRDAKQASITLPEVPDGDYLLRARVRSELGEDQVDLPLPLYAPARIHVLTDRPLYEPGNEVQFRAVVVRARDLTPIDHRPGMWIVSDPSGQVLLEEKAPAGAWGVVAGSFPLDQGAPTGAWRVSWRSGDDEADASFRVEPFTLPRFRVEATAEQPFYGPGESPAISGSVVYSSGAPVAGAALELDWQVHGRWPPPTAWTQDALPKRATTDDAGRFVLALPEVPGDLQGQVTLAAQIAAVDAAGDRVQGAASVLLSQDAIAVQALTELGDGLVANANNRLYLRVTTADGRPLPGAAIHVRQAWNAADPGLDAELDDDSVARVQIDPGPPVNVVVPALPVRAQSSTPGPIVSLAGAVDLVTDQPAPIADQMAMERWLEPVGACARWVADAPESVAVTLRVSRQGTIADATSAPTPVATCVRDILRRQRLPAGAERMYALTFRIVEPPLPRLEAAFHGAHAGAVQTMLTRAALDARGCLPGRAELPDPEVTELPWVLAWRVRAGSRRIAASWIRNPAAPAPTAPTAGTAEMPAGVISCVLSRVGRHPLEEPAAQDSMGVVRYTLAYPYEPDTPPAPQPTIMKGYELLVTAEVAGEPVGQTRLRMEPGQIPRLRLRADPVLASPGDEVRFTLIRGPSFEGTLPEKLTVRHLGQREEIELDEKTRSASFAVPADARGWYQAEAAGERALVYVRSSQDLELAITPEEPRYPPGALARLRLRTRVGGQGGPAAVGLVGVDQSLSQLAPLPGPDALASLQPEIAMSSAAFATLDAQALTLGRIRGDHAAEAAILRVARIPDPADIDAVVGGAAETAFDPVAILTDRFYVILAELHAQTRAWEESAPPDETMQPATMAALWTQAVDACEARGQEVTDAFGRRLRLRHLPPDLLALTDPREVVVVGTRLPEDVENWSHWVARKRP